MSESSLSTVSLTSLINGMLPAMTATETRIADVVLRDPAAIAQLTITELAATAGSSQASVVRFCRTLGLRGHRELRMRAVRAADHEDDATDASVAGGDIPDGADMRRVIDTVAYADANAVAETARALDTAECERVVDELVNARRLDVYGAGASGVVSTDLAQKLHRIGCTVCGWQDPHAALTGAALLTPGTVALGISHSGATADTVDFLARARRQGATTVALTDHPRSPVTGVADYVLITVSGETTFRSGATASRIAQLTVVDCLFVGVAARSRERATAALTITKDALEQRRMK